MGTPYNLLVGNPPDARTLAWDAWFQKLLEYRVAAIPRTRSTTYYFSQSSGNDGNPGTQAQPFQTIAKCQLLINAAATNANIAFLWKRGDEWNEDTGITNTKNFITFADYGTGAKPLWNRFTSKYNSAGWTQAGATDRWTRAATTQIANVRLQTARLTAYLRVASTAAVEATPNSFYWASNVLHINVGVGVSPNTLNLEGVTDNVVSGIGTSGNNIRIQNMRGDGWGHSPTTTASQAMFCTSLGGNTTECIFVGCESYFNGSHCMTHLASNPADPGGILTMIDCKAGYAMYNGSSGETIFNLYSNGGQQECILVNCEATYGCIPTSDWLPGTIGATTRGESVYGHTSGDNVPCSLIIGYNCTVPNNLYGCNAPFYISNIPPDNGSILNCRVFIINDTMAYRIGGAWTVGAPGMVQRGCSYSAKPADISFGGGIQGQTIGGFVLDCTLQYDLGFQSWFMAVAYYSNQAAGTAAKTFWANNFVRAYNLRSDRTFTLITSLNGTDTIPNAKFYNNIFWSDGMVWTDVAVGSVQSSNAYYGLNTTASNPDASAIVLFDAPTIGSIPEPSSQIYRVGSLSAGLRVDANRNAFSPNFPDLGPLSSFVLPYNGYGLSGLSQAGGLSLANGLSI